jgi:hypothetical protein
MLAISHSAGSSMTSEEDRSQGSDFKNGKFDRRSYDDEPDGSINSDSVSDIPVEVGLRANPQQQPANRFPSSSADKSVTTEVEKLTKLVNQLRLEKTYLVNVSSLTRIFYFSHNKCNIFLKF